MLVNFAKAYSVTVCWCFADEIKPCPRCSAFIIKMDDGSCNHMTCAVCGAEFCWLCMKEISDLHYLRSPTVLFVTYLLEYWAICVTDYPRSPTVLFAHWVLIFSLYLSTRYKVFLLYCLLGCLTIIVDIFCSPSGCTFWGKKPWSRKKKILWQLGTLVGAPVGISLIAAIAVPAIIIGVPIWVGRKVSCSHSNFPLCIWHGVKIWVVLHGIGTFKMLALLSILSNRISSFALFLTLCNVAWYFHTFASSAVYVVDVWLKGLYSFS